MSSGDWIQAATLLSVAVALFLNARQNREVARQTRELTEQNTAILRSMQQNAYQALITHPTAIRVSSLWDDPALLEWHLANRGLPAGTFEENKRRLFTILKLETHEMCYLSHADGLLTDDVWTGWFNVMCADVLDDGFGETWTCVRRFFAPTFVAFVDEMIVDLDQPGTLRPVA